MIPVKPAIYGLGGVALVGTLLFGWSELSSYARNWSSRRAGIRA